MSRFNFGSKNVTFFEFEQTLALPQSTAVATSLAAMYEYIYLPYLAFSFFWLYQ